MYLVIITGFLRLIYILYRPHGILSLQFLKFDVTSRVLSPGLDSFLEAPAKCLWMSLWHVPLLSPMRPLLRSAPSPARSETAKLLDSAEL